MALRVRAALLLLLLLWPSAARAARLPSTVRPAHYALAFVVDLARARFEGTETIRVELTEPTSRIVLHALDLDIHEVTIDQGPVSEHAAVSLDEHEQTATLSVRQPLATGAADIHVRFTGVLNDKLRGFYLSRTATRRYAVTQFESTDARRAFPCFDEPAFKATFAITLTIDRGDTAISNGAVVSDRPGPARTQHTMRFATSPKMSTYLVAMAVGQFRCLDATEEAVPIRVCATPDKTRLGRIALDSARQILKYYNGYYAIRYPFGKLDVVAVPDFAAGAMENTAAIFYREADLLANEKTASVATRKNIASVLAHEMAHQWFGDLVTMAWWDDLWLNEGFATWMANHPLTAWKPEWNIPVDEALETETALSVDSLKPTRPIHANVETPDEIEAAFDTIAYEKSAAVLRMIESYVGPDVFRQGVNTYLQAHAYGNATAADFWVALAAVSGKPVDRILPTFVNQAGFPLVSASIACAGTRTDLTLTQERFFPDAALLEQGSPERWQVPICSNPPDGKVTCDILSERAASLSVDATQCHPWVFANAGARGYYRTAYDRAALRALVPNVERALTAPERLSLASDEWALVRAGRQNVADYMTLAAGYGPERVAGVLSLVTDRLELLEQYLATLEVQPKLQAFVRSLLRPSLDEVGFASAPNDDDARRSLRAVLILALGTTGADPSVIADARAAADRALGGGTPLDPTGAVAVLDVAAAHGDARLFERVWDAAAHAASPEEHYRYLYTLAEFRDPTLIDRALAAAISPQLRSQDTSLYLARFFSNPVARPRAWAFIKAHWAELEPKVTIAEGDTRLARALGAFCDPAARDDVKAFFAAHPLPTAGRALEQAIGQIDNCMAMRGTQAPVLAEWFEHR